MRKIGLMLLALVVWPFTAHAGGLVAAAEGESFDVAQAVPDHELAKMRGGFVTLSGLTIEFALNTRILIDGVAQKDVEISSVNLAGINPSDLRQIIQIGPGNEAAALDAIANNPGILTVVQNTQNDKLIQQFNNLDITVSNLARFRNEQLTPSLDFQAVTALR